MLEIVSVGTWYAFGSKGLPALRQLKQENVTLDARIHQLSSEINTLTREIADFKTYPYFREKIAREELQLIAPGDELYLVTPTQG